MGVNAYFGPGIKNELHKTSSYGPGKSKFEIDYSKQTYCLPEKLDRVQGMLEKSGQEVVYSTKYFN